MRSRFAFRFALAASVFAAAFVVQAAPAVAGTTTIGQTSGDASCASNLTWFQTSGSVSYAVPSGNWTLSSWSTRAGGTGDSGQMALVVVRPAGGGSYTVVYVGPTETLTPSSLNTFAASVAVQGGDIIGFWTNGNTNCAISTGSGSDVFSYQVESKPTVGETESGLSTDFPYLLNISATLTAGAGAVIPQVNNLFVCYSRYEQDGGAIFQSSAAIALLNDGYWIPSAVAGNITDGDNLGAYHLECNPPAGLEPTGRYIGDGGDVVSNTVAADAVYGYYPIVG